MSLCQEGFYEVKVADLKQTATTRTKKRARREREAMRVIIKSEGDQFPIISVIVASGHLIDWAGFNRAESYDSAHESDQKDSAGYNQYLCFPSQ